MTSLAFSLPDEVRSKLSSLGAAGSAWQNELPAKLADLQREWDIRIGSAVLTGGSAALIVPATTRDGRAAVLKLAIPGEAIEAELRVLLWAGGRGYAQVLNYDVSRRAMLIERLGPRLDELGLSVHAQIEVICATLRQAWLTTPDQTRVQATALDTPLQTGAEKARYLSEFITGLWRELNAPCSAQAYDMALEFADARARAFDPAASVLVHGDAHSANTLRVLGTPASGDSGFRFVDPDGMWAEPACDLAVPMREYSEDLLAGDAYALGRARSVQLGQLTGVPAEPIWQWGFMERMSSGLYVLRLGWEQMGRDMLNVADAWARGPTA